MRVEASGGSGQVASPYNLLTSYAYNATAGSTDIVATTAGTSEDTTYSVYFLSNIASQTEAGQYSTTITYVITANF
jgi:spore coat protein U-like protein